MHLLLHLRLLHLRLLHLHLLRLLHLLHLLYLLHLLHLLRVVEAAPDSATAPVLAVASDPLAAPPAVQGMLLSVFLLRFSTNSFYCKAKQQLEMMRVCEREREVRARIDSTRVTIPSSSAAFTATHHGVDRVFTARNGKRGRLHRNADRPSSCA
jgi:hypothetical protein